MLEALYFINLIIYFKAFPLAYRDHSICLTFINGDILILDILCKIIFRTTDHAAFF